MSAGDAHIGKAAPDFACQALVDGDFKTVKLRYDIILCYCAMRFFYKVSYYVFNKHRAVPTVMILF